MTNQVMPKWKIDTSRRPSRHCSGTRCRSQRVGSASAQDLRYLLMRSGSTLRLTDSRIAANDPVAPIRQRLKVGELGRALD